MFSDAAFAQSPFAAVGATGAIYAVDVSEIGVANDELTALPSKGVAVEELVTAADVLDARLPFSFAAVLETSIAGDTPTTRIVVRSRVTDLARATVLEVANLQVPAALSDAVLAADTVSALRTMYPSRSETALATDSQVGYIRVPAARSETATAIDAATAARVNLRGRVTELARPSEVLTTISAARIFVSDSATAQDSPTTNTSVRSSVADTAIATDSQVGYKRVPASRSETATAQDAQASRVRFPVSRSETATALAETINTNLTFVARAVELAIATMAPVQTIGSLHPVLSDSVTASDVNLMNGSLFVRRQEFATIFDNPVGRRLWEPVIDTQDPMWVIIPTTPI